MSIRKGQQVGEVLVHEKSKGCKKAEPVVITYIRSGQQVGEIFGDQKPKSRKEVYQAVAKRFSMRKLGRLKDLGKNHVVVKLKDESRLKLKVEKSVSDMLFTAGAFVDMRQDHRVVLFGRRKKGVVVQCVALNRNSLNDWLSQSQSA